MSAPKTTKRPAIFLLIAVIAVTLFAGLHPKDYRFRNNVTATSDGLGLEFDRYGVAYTEPFLSPETAKAMAQSGFTMTLALDPNRREQDSFAFITLIHAGKDPSQLVLGQWKDFLIVMNGDDYRHRLRLPRISTRLDPSAEATRFVAVTSGGGGTALYVDGDPVKEDRGLRLSLPGAPRPGRLVLGNSLGGRQSWKGVVRDFALYDRVLGADEIKRLSEVAEAGEASADQRPSSLLVHYPMSQFRDGRVPDESGNGIDLQVPARDVMPEKRFFAQPFGHQFEANASFVEDLGINLYGFIPFGAVLSVVLYGRGFRGRPHLLIVLGAAVVLSGGIELAQAWLPSRDSSVLDVTLNVLGAVCGSVGVLLFARFYPGFSQTAESPIA